MKTKNIVNTNIVVSCWNALEYTAFTLQSLFSSTRNPYFLTIINNGSIDGTKEYLKNLKTPSFCKKLTIINNRTNKGAGEAINQGQKISKKYNLKYTCLCNNDLFFQKNWLLKLEESLNKNKSIGIIGTLRPSVDASHHTKSKSTKYVVDNTPKNYSILEELDYFQDGFSFENTCKMLIKENKGGIKFLICPPNAVITCCALIRNSISKKIGNFSDSQFKIYGSEDIDLSWRIQSAGYKCAILKDVYIHHFRHKSIKASNLNREKYLIQNNRKLYKKWKKSIFNFIKIEEFNEVNILNKLKTEDDTEYFFFRRILENTNFMIEYNHEHTNNRKGKN